MGPPSPPARRAASASPSRRYLLPSAQNRTVSSLDAVPLIFAVPIPLLGRAVPRLVVARHAAYLLNCVLVVSSSGAVPRGRVARGSLLARTVPRLVVVLRAITPVNHALMVLRLVSGDLQLDCEHLSSSVPLRELVALRSEVASPMTIPQPARWAIRSASAPPSED